MKFEYSFQLITAGENGCGNDTLRKSLHSGEFPAKSEDEAETELQNIVRENRTKSEEGLRFTSSRIVDLKLRRAIRVFM